MAPLRRRVTLGMDIGSTEVRALYIFKDDDDKIERHIVHNRHDHRKSIHYMGFSSRILVHDEQGEPYIGNRKQVGQGAREESSAKYAAYLLVGKVEQFMEQYPVLSRLEDLKKIVGKDVLIARLEKAFDQLLRFVFEATKRNLEQWRPEMVQMQVDKLVLTIPSPWNRDFEALYKRLIPKAFRAVFADRPDLAVQNPAVQFVTEADGLANYTMLKALIEHRRGLGLPTMDQILSQASNAQLFIDCGGHNVNTTLTSFNGTSDGSGAMCQLARPEGAGGGCEMLFHDVAEQAIAKYREKTNDHSPIPGWVRHEAKQQAVFAFKNGTGWVNFTHATPGTDQSEPVRITEEMLKKGFETGFKHVMKLVRGQLEKLVGIQSRWETAADQQIVSVIASGGSSLHPDFHEWLVETCRELGLNEPHFTLNMEHEYGANRIATGAAYASLIAQSIESFSQKCAFGLQQGNVMRGTDELDLETTAKTIWYDEQTVPVEVVATGGKAEYRITCQPALETLTETLQIDSTGARGSSYDLLNIGCLPDFHKYRVEFSFNVRQKQIQVKLRQVPAGTGRNAARIGQEFILGPFPVYIEVGSGNLLIDLDHDELDRRIKASFELHWHYTYRGNDDEDLPDAPSDDEDRPENQGAARNENAADDEDPADLEGSDGDEDMTDADYLPGAGSGRGNNARRSAIGGANYDGGDDRSDIPRAPAGTAANDAADGIADEDDDEPLIPRARPRGPSRSTALDDSSSESEDNDDGLDKLRVLADVASRASRSETTASTATSNANDAATTASSSGRGVFPSKAATARATEGAFRSRNEVYRNASPGSRAGSGAPAASRGAASTAVPSQSNRTQPGSNASVGWQPPAGGFATPSSRAADTQRGQPTTRKRPAPGTPDDARSQKRVQTSGGGPSGSSNNARRPNESRPVVPAEPVWRGTARRRDRSDAPSPEATPPAKRHQGAPRDSTDGPRAPVRHMMKRNPANNILLGRSATTPVREQPRQGNTGINRSFEGLSLGRDDRAATRPASGTSASPSESRPTRGPRSAAEYYAMSEAERLAYRSRDRSRGDSRGDSRGGSRAGGNVNSRSSNRAEPQPPRTSGPAGGSQGHPRGYRGFGPANRGRGHRPSD